ncbi:hypothetical protein EVAR_95652_1 [Eumeta japonica]|uniref:Uncharacterized protein n=1 Tax=Eumeta variegata TaxID=151549 RepID=A0A4C1VJY1_EUMVA|nr:hypothetical protein EVAR_95652_1 [Eumeta japonica]
MELGSKTSVGTGKESEVRLGSESKTRSGLKLILIAPSYARRRRNISPFLWACILYLNVRGACVAGLCSCALTSLLSALRPNALSAGADAARRQPASIMRRDRNRGRNWERYRERQRDWKKERRRIGIDNKTESVLNVKSDLKSKTGLDRRHVLRISRRHANRWQLILRGVPSDRRKFGRALPRNGFCGVAAALKTEIEEKMGVVEINRGVNFTGPEFWEIPSPKRNSEFAPSPEQPATSGGPRSWTGLLVSLVEGGAALQHPVALKHEALYSVDRRSKLKNSVRVTGDAE